MMRDSQDENLVGKDAVDQVVRKAVHAELADTSAEVRPQMGILLQPGERVLNLRRQSHAQPGHAALQEGRGFGEIVLRFQQQANVAQRPSSRARTRANASAAGTDCVSPAR
jgi:hypothetical protein